MWQQLLPGFRIMAVMTVLTGVIYPLVMTGITQAILPAKANGSLITKNGQVVGSSLLAQGFSKPEYFHPRPSAAGGGYDATSSGGTNLGPTSAKLTRGTTKMDDKKNEVVDFDGLNLRVLHFALDNGIAYDSSVPLDQFKGADGNLDDVKLIKAFNDDKAPLIFTPKAAIPSDAVTASGSGLDPHISPASAEAQLARVASARHITPETLHSIVAAHTEGPDLGFLGEARVNVLLLNLDLDQKYPAQKLAQK